MIKRLLINVCVQRIATRTHTRYLSGIHVTLKVRLEGGDPRALPAIISDRVRYTKGNQKRLTSSWPTHASKASAVVSPAFPRTIALGAGSPITLYSPAFFPPT